MQTVTCREGAGAALAALSRAVEAVPGLAAWLVSAPVGPASILAPVHAADASSVTLAAPAPPPAGAAAGGGGAAAAAAGGVSDSDGFYAGWTAELVGGPRGPGGGPRLVSGYSGATRVLRVLPPWDPAPAPADGDAGRGLLCRLVPPSPLGCVAKALLHPDWAAGHPDPAAAAAADGPRARLVVVGGSLRLLQALWARLDPPARAAAGRAFAGAGCLPWGVRVAGGGAEGGGELVNGTHRWRCLTLRVYPTAPPGAAGGDGAAGVRSRSVTVFGGAGDPLVPQRGQPVRGPVTRSGGS